MKILKIARVSLAAAALISLSLGWRPTFGSGTEHPEPPEKKPAKEGIRPGEIPPEIKAKSLDGRSLSLADLKGKVLLLDFWATWCGPCLREVPNLKKLHKTYHDRGLEIVSISLDQDEESLRSFVKDQGLNWTHVFNGSLPEGKDPATRYAVTAIPHMMLIGRDGKIIDVELRGSALEAAVKKAIP